MQVTAGGARAPRWCWRRLMGSRGSRAPGMGCILPGVHQGEPGACSGPNPVTMQVPEPAPWAVTSQPPALSPPSPLGYHLLPPCSVTSPAPQRRPQSLPWLWGRFGQSSFLHPEIRKVRGTGFGSRTWHSCHSGACRVHGTCWQDLSSSAASEHPPGCLLQPRLVQGPQVSFPA